MSKVAIYRCIDYDQKRVSSAIVAAIESFGGIDLFVKPGQKVLLKPNLLVSQEPKKAITTHPSFVEAIVDLVQECGGIPIIGDGSSIGNWDDLVKKTGMKEIAEEKKIGLINLNKVGAFKSKGVLYHDIELAQILKEVDVVINIPKIKTHTQMYVTGAIKNLFGTVVGERKRMWHLRAGIDYMAFANLILDIYLIVKPALTIVDGVIALEGNGPGAGGRPRPLGVVLAGIDCVAIDQVISEIIGANTNYFYTLLAAKERDVGVADLRQIDLDGDCSLEEVTVKDFVFPEMAPILLGPKILQNFIRKHLTARPVIIDNSCIQCENCVEVCPSNSISTSADNLHINYNDCIRCFCCIEVCPQGALESKSGFLRRALGKIGII